MKIFLHKRFIQNNHLNISDFSQPVQTKLSIFDKYLDKHDKLKGDEQTELYYKMEELDHEILQDILNEMEHQLENNDLPDEEEKKEAPTASKKAAPSRLSDEQILDSLWTAGNTKELGRSFLKERGIQHPLSGWVIRIGKYTLYRAAVFRIVFNLKKNK